MRIIPAIDIIDGKCVRLSLGDFSTKKIYGENPLEMAKRFEAHGVQFLHLVDLDGAKSGAIVNHKILEQIALKTSLKVDFGGGIKSRKELKIAFDSGAAQVTGGSIAVHDRELFKSWIAEFGPDKIILGADVKDGEIAVSGWSEVSKMNVLPFIRGYQSAGIKYVICTDISKDGMLGGPGVDLYENILADSQNLMLIASGGVSTYKDLIKLKSIGCEGAIIGKAIYEGRITLAQIEKFTTTC